MLGAPALIAAALGLLSALVLWFPAHWASPALARASGQTVRLANAQGTVWNGSAQVVLTGGTGSRDAATLPGRVAWRIRPGWASDPVESAAPALRATLTQDCCLRQPLRLALTRASGSTVVRLDTLDWQGPAGLLRGLGTPWNTLAFEGALKLHAQGLQWRQGPQGWHLRGSVSALAESVSSRISTVRPLGSYRMEVDSRQDGTTLALSTQEGAALQLSGEGAFIGGQLRFQGSARAAPERREALGNVLNLIGNRNGPVALRILR